MADKQKKGKPQAAPAEDMSEMMKVRREKMEAFRSMGVAPFGHRYDVTVHVSDIHAKFDHLEGEE